jgi:hypothetical protein
MNACSSLVRQRRLSVMNHTRFMASRGTQDVIEMLAYL